MAADAGRRGGDLLDSGAGADTGRGATRPRPARRGLRSEAIGRAARLEFVEGIIKTFPDGRIERVRSFGAGDRGCIQFRFKDTNTGPSATPDGGEAPATNKPVAFPYCVVARFKDGQIAELDEYFDQTAMLMQLGVAP